MSQLLERLGAQAQASQGGVRWQGIYTSWATVWREAGLRATRLQQLTAGAERVGIYLPNSLEAVIAVVAVLRAGMTTVPLFASSDEASIAKTMAYTTCDYLITDRDNLALTGIKQISLRQLSADAGKAAVAPGHESVSEVHLASLFFTSGSTGAPKALMHDHASLLGFANNLIELLQLDDATRYLVAQPMGHIGVIVVTLAVWLAGAEVILLPGFDCENYLDQLAKTQPTHINLHTPLFYQLLNSPRLCPQMFAKAKVCFAAGDTMDPGLPAAFLARTGVALTTGYGSSEMGLPLVNRELLGEHVLAMGQALDGFELRLVDDKGQAVPAADVGELWLRSPACMVGYWQQPEKRAEVLVQGWYRSGDLFRCDEQGFYWYYGRKSQAFHWQGEMVYPLLLEQGLMRAPGVGCAAVLMDSEAKIHVFVESDEALSEASWQERLEPFWPNTLPLGDLHVMERLPLNYTGKVDRLLLRDNYLMDH
jgi:acyl-CoA synthetase (AMP-forming)/AMP-acid ligase II